MSTVETTRLSNWPARRSRFSDARLHSASASTASRPVDRLPALHPVSCNCTAHHHARPSETPAPGIPGAGVAADPKARFDGRVDYGTIAVEQPADVMTVTVHPAGHAAPTV